MLNIRGYGKIEYIKGKNGLTLVKTATEWETTSEKHFENYSNYTKNFKIYSYLLTKI
jgi:hypothetical protein